MVIGVQTYKQQYFKARTWFQRASADARLHEEWRICVLALVFAASCAASYQFETLAGYIASGLLFGAIVAVLFWRRGAALLAVAATASGLAMLEQERFPALQPPQEDYVSFRGTVERLEYRPEGSNKLVIRLTSSAGKMEASDKLSLWVRTEIAPNIQIGDVVQGAAMLEHRQKRLVPGGYDFSQKARFEGVTATGYAASSIDLVHKRSAGQGDLQNRIRYELAGRIQKVMPGQAGGLTVALTLGLRHGLSDETKDALRRAGLAHLLAISGLHMGIVAAAAFFIFEALFAAIPALALRIMPRKLAVFPAWLFALVYLLLSGGSSSTQRAFIMVSVAMLAILANRRVISLRSVALAALIILAISPHSILSIGFQMSFAATIGLVVFYERSREWLQSYNLSQQALGSTKKAFFAVMGIGLTSLIAQISIAPIALYHFQAISIIGVVANMVVLPVISFLVMPALMLTLILAMFDAVSLVAWLVGPLLDSTLWLSGYFADFTYAVLHTGQPTFVALSAVLLAAAILIGVYGHVSQCVAGGLILLSLAVPARGTADVLISETGRMIAYKQDGTVQFSGGRRGSFREELWLRYWGVDIQSKIAPLSYYGNRDNRGFVLADGSKLYITEHLSKVRSACASGGIVILPRKYLRYCKGAELVISFQELSEKGPLGLALRKDKPPKMLWSNPA